MERTKLISVRIDADTLERLDQLTKQERYWKRNAIINNVLTSLFFNATDADIMKLARWWRHSSDSLEISVNNSSM